MSADIVDIRGHRARAASALTLPDDIEALYAEWVARINASGLSEETSAVCDEITAIERKMAATATVTPSALLCKAKIADYYTRIGWVYEEERNMLVSLINDLEWLARAAARP
jgi:hypothetical protein